MKINYNEILPTFWNHIKNNYLIYVGLVILATVAFNMLDCEKDVEYTPVPVTVAEMEKPNIVTLNLDNFEKTEPYIKGGKKYTRYRIHGAIDEYYTVAQRIETNSTK